MAKISEMKNILVNVAKNGFVPFVRGLHGIGKSEMMLQVAEELSAYFEKPLAFHVIDMAHVKEGELTGMPITVKDEKTGCMINTYTTYMTFNQVIKDDKEGFLPVIFFDEINRTSREVFNELMPIILSKRVQETKLPESLIILTAGNPEDISKYEGSKDDYSVLPMDPAMKNRFFIFELEVDTVEWLNWAIKEEVDDDVIQFISEYPNMLHFLSENEINPTPRGWKMFSDVLKSIKKGKLEDYEDSLILTGRGIIGTDTTVNFIRFLRENRNPLLKPEDFFNADESKLKITLNKLKKETPTRQCVIMTRLTKYIIENSDDSLIPTYFEALFSVPKDITIGTIIDIKNASKMLLVKIVKYDSSRMNEMSKYLI